MKRPAAISYPSDVAFTPTVKAIQNRKGSRPCYASMEERGSWETRISGQGIGPRSVSVDIEPGQMNHTSQLPGLCEKAGCAPEVPGSVLQEPNLPRMFDAACFLVVV
jgi:hypothetical protein